jgi:hypothetical protein
LAIDVSRTFMKTASDSAIVPITSVVPVSGGNSGGLDAGAGPDAVTAAGPAGGGGVPDELSPLLMSAMLAQPDLWMRSALARAGVISTGNQAAFSSMRVK